MFVYIHPVYLFCRDCVTGCILSMFAGPPGTGVFSPSVQQTLYDTERLALAKVPQVKFLSYAVITLVQNPAQYSIY